MRRNVLIAVLVTGLSFVAFAQGQTTGTSATTDSKSGVKAAAKSGVLGPEEVRKLVPPSFFFHGQHATSQVRNAAAIRLKNDERVVIASLVDTSGYSSDVAQRYQGFLISEGNISIAGKKIGPGAYGIGTTEKGEFVLQDLGWNDLLVVQAQVDNELKRPRPLQMTGKDGSYRLYLGKKYVEITE